MRNKNNLAGQLIFIFFVAVALIFKNGYASPIGAQSLFWPIDLSRPGAHVKTDVEIRENQNYVFYLAVHYRDEEERKRAFALVGSGRRSNKTGEYVDPGVTFPVHLKLIRDDGVVMLDEMHETQGNAGHGLGPSLSGYYLRELGEACIAPGLYHLEITILKPVSEFQNFECAIVIGMRPPIIGTRPPIPSVRK